ncbi:hypothetical protein CY34DRAFT_78154, partial [Suillus luteus UH-Slu-Lm8-n1]
VTTSLEKAKQFLDVMCEGHPEYGCIISKQKTLTNFEHDSIQAANITERNQKRMFNQTSLLCCFLKIQ